jgi:bidirectional [NiFe] hydrogenase diaphorase subunit
VSAATVTPAPSPSDRRWKVVDARMRRLGHRPDAVIEVLHTVQDAFGYLDPESMAYVSAALHVPPSRLYGVATFYSYFVLKPQGEHTCVVCTGTACYINGASRILERIEDRLGITAGETTPDDKLSLLTAHCIGACSIAPAVVVDERIRGRVDPGEIAEELAKL